MARAIDWERIEPGWRAGIKSVLQLAADYKAETGNDISHTAINKHFKKLGITRDLSAKVRAKAEAMVSEAVVSGKVSIETTETDAKIINANAVVVAEAHLSQRKDISRSRKIVMSLLGELEFQTDNLELLESLGDLLHEPDERGVDKRYELFQKVISLGSRAGTMKQLADSLKTLVGLEREALNMGAPMPDGEDGKSVLNQEERDALNAIVRKYRDERS